MFGRKKKKKTPGATNTKGLCNQIIKVEVVTSIFNQYNYTTSTLNNTRGETN